MDMSTFYDAEAIRSRCRIGNTWVQLMSIYYDDPVA